MSNFYETLQKLGYESNSKGKGYESFKRNTSWSEVYVYFDFMNKTIHGFIVPKDLIRTMDYLVQLRSDFIGLQENLKYFAMLSKYVIID